MYALQDNRLLRKFHIPSKVLSHEFARNDAHGTINRQFSVIVNAVDITPNSSTEQYQHETILHCKPKFSLKIEALVEDRSLRRS